MNTFSHQKSLLVTDANELLLVLHSLWANDWTGRVTKSTTWSVAPKYFLQKVDQKFFSEPKAMFLQSFINFNLTFKCIDLLSSFDGLSYIYSTLILYFFNERNTTGWSQDGYVVMLFSHSAIVWVPCRARCKWEENFVFHHVLTKRAKLIYTQIIRIRIIFSVKLDHLYRINAKLAQF